MMQYLDNQQNAAGKINENYAREIMELHTMGVGSGYSQKDVQELARILTGVGVNLSAPARTPARDFRTGHADYTRRQGLFEFVARRHDYGDKLFLGHDHQGRGPGGSRRRPSTSWRASRHGALCLHASWRSISAATRRRPR